MTPRIRASQVFTVARPLGEDGEEGGGNVFEEPRAGVGILGACAGVHEGLHAIHTVGQCIRCAHHVWSV